MDSTRSRRKPGRASLLWSWLIGLVVGVFSVVPVSDLLDRMDTHRQAWWLGGISAVLIGAICEVWFRIGRYRGRATASIPWTGPVAAGSFLVAYVAVAGDRVTPEHTAAVQRSFDLKQQRIQEDLDRQARVEEAIAAAKRHTATTFPSEEIRGHRAEVFEHCGQVTVKTVDQASFRNLRDVYVVWQDGAWRTSDAPPEVPFEPEPLAARYLRAAIEDNVVDDLRPQEELNAIFSSIALDRVEVEGERAVVRGDYLSPFLGVRTPAAVELKKALGFCWRPGRILEW